MKKTICIAFLAMLLMALENKEDAGAIRDTDFIENYDLDGNIIFSLGGLEEY